MPPEDSLPELSQRYRHESRLGPMRSLPAGVGAAVELALHDLQQPEPMRLLVGWTEGCPDDEQSRVWVQEVGQQGTTGIAVTTTLTDLDLLLRIVDHLQDLLFESAGAWGQARPACPMHDHPALPEARDSEAWWVCPTTREGLVRIGDWPPAA